MDGETERSTRPHQIQGSVLTETETGNKIALQGLLLPSTDHPGVVTPKEILANITVQGSTRSNNENVHSETRNFFDKKSEDTFLSLCAQGYSNLPAKPSTVQSRSEEDWQKTHYLSKLKHTWFLEKWFEMQRGTRLELSQEAVKSLQTISRRIGLSAQESAQEDIQTDISAFFNKFGSHVPLGPFALGGRMVEKISCSDFGEVDKKVLWEHIETEFRNMDPHKVDRRYESGLFYTLPTKSKDEKEKTVNINRTVIVFGGNSEIIDLKRWKDDLPKSALVISGAVSLYNLKPVWDITVDCTETFGKECVELHRKLKDAWCNESPPSDSSHPKKGEERTSTEDALRVKATGNQESETNQTTTNKDVTNENTKSGATEKSKLLDQLHLDETSYGLAAATSLRKADLENEDANGDVMWKFLRSINTLDYRGRTCLKMILQKSTKNTNPPDDTETDIFTQMKLKEEVVESQTSTISAMDVTLAILHSCDAFLKQEVLWKMTECRLAVPILLPGLEDRTDLEFQLWGLRKTYKTWQSRVTNKLFLEKSVVTHPMPIVSFLRFGKVTFSKSKLINKILGKLQGNNDHSFFVDLEEEEPCATFSKGTIEVVWFIPEGTSDDKNCSALRDAVTFFNLRGDAIEFSVQKTFSCRASDVVVVLVEEDRYEEYLDEIRNISTSMAKHLMCIISSSDSHTSSTIIRHGNVTMIRSKQFLADVGADICQELNQILWDLEDKHRSQFNCLESLTDICKHLHIRVDEQNEDSVLGKRMAKKVAVGISKSPETYKESHLPLQGKLWKKWVKVDKKWTKAYAEESFDTMEHYQDNLKRQLLEIRKKQQEKPPEKDLIDIANALNLPQNQRKYFVAWLNFFLNEISQADLAPLRKTLRDIQKDLRKINWERSKLKDKSEMSNDDQTKLQELKHQDKNLSKKTREIAAKIDSGCLGMEHFMREFGQRYEAYEELKAEADTDVDSQINPGALPDIAAKLLMDGHPLEILDGDVGRVPIKWVQAVFKSVMEKVGSESRVSAISVLGVQSSGKSTLLNSMFGVRFAVSAGRCTRGVFIQLLKVNKDLEEQIDCDYLIVIDTEGLKAPERSFRNDFRHDNELATFALCLADQTIINIAGQTVGKDMTDVLQIAAHAFIRMKEVNIKSSCRIIQQFVADLAAVDKNEASTLGILRSLDEAISAAATDEGYGKLYTRFSDVFNVKRNEEVQYIPSLWQGSMAPPNHRYSERITKLKKIIIEDMKRSKRTFQQFVQRITDVWDAVKEENFIFYFQNCVIALRYKTFQHVYGKWIGEMRLAIMEWESNARQCLKNVSKDNLQDIKAKLKSEITIVVERECEKIQEKILKYLQENVTDDDDQLHRFEDEFMKDLDLTQRQFIQDTKETLDRIVDSIMQLNQMDILLPKCKNQLREKARKQAVELRKNYATTVENESTSKEIDADFEKFWKCWIKEICKDYPPRQVTIDEVQIEFASYLIVQGEKKDVSKGLKQRLGLRRGKLVRIAANISEKVWGEQNEIVKKIIKDALETLKKEVDDDLSYDPAIIQKLIDSTIHALNDKYGKITLMQNIKIDAILKVCEQAVPIILEGRKAYNTKYSLRELLMKEEETLKKDFRALCSTAFQDKRASESLTSLLNENVIDMVQNYLGPAIYKAVRESCPYFVSKFAMFGYVLEDMAEKEDFDSYCKFIFDLEEFLEEWSLNKIAQICLEENSDGRSFVELIVTEKVEKIRETLISVVNSTVSEVGLTCESTERNVQDDNSAQTLVTWIKLLCQKLENYAPELCLSEEDVRNLLLFDVKDITFFGDLVKDYIDQRLTQGVVEGLNFQNMKEIKAAEKMLVGLPTKPHKDIKKHVSGCTEQCPICHAPCDNMTLRHKKHRAELHYPEGLVGCANDSSNRLVCAICTSSITTNEHYQEGNVSRKYSEFHKDFPNWVIQPIQNDSPLNYWKWVMSRFNKDFARLYGRKEALLPEGWMAIKKKQAIEDLQEAYVTREIFV